jgi:hypothetical protein
VAKRLIAALAIITGAVIVIARPIDPDFRSAYSGHTCPMMEPRAFTLPDDKIEAQADFFAKAKRLRADGHCVMDGNFGRGHGKFYFTIDKNGKPQDFFIMRFTREELKK